nr:PREDICTED: E3 ubiquitin-protein ligase UPL5-like isoform X1 [Daucus carota subsp. sativus]
MVQTFFRPLNKMDCCLEEREKFFPTKSENLGCYQYVAIIMKLSNMSKHFPALAGQFWTTLRNRKLSFRYLIIKFASKDDDYGWISEHKEVTTFECRRHLAMMLLSRVSDEDNSLILEILINKSRFSEDSFEYIAHAEAETLQASLHLQFKDEEATGPGVLREWFILVCQAIFDPRNALFVACPNDRRRFFPNPVISFNISISRIYTLKVVN